MYAYLNLGTSSERSSAADRAGTPTRCYSIVIEIHVAESQPILRFKMRGKYDGVFAPVRGWDGQQFTVTSTMSR